jgi:hypothetical protein
MIGIPRDSLSVPNISASDVQCSQIRATYKTPREVAFPCELSGADGRAQWDSVSDIKFRALHAMFEAEFDEILEGVTSSSAYPAKVGGPPL